MKLSHSATKGIKKHNAIKVLKKAFSSFFSFFYSFVFLCVLCG